MCTTGNGYVGYLAGTLHGELVNFNLFREREREKVAVRVYGFSLKSGYDLWAPERFIERFSISMSATSFIGTEIKYTPGGYINPCRIGPNRFLPIRGFGITLWASFLHRTANRRESQSFMETPAKLDGRVCDG